MILKLRILIGQVARKALAAANIDPGYVRALIKPMGQVHGGPRARRFPWPKRSHFGQEERRAVMGLIDREIRRGGAIIYNGPEKAGYCSEFADWLGGGFAETVNSGTNAVYVALRSLDLEAGSEVIVPPITDPGGTMPVVMMNCIPVPADTVQGSLNTSAEEIAKVITARTSAILIAHIAGQTLDMDPILALAAEHGIPVVEDCAQAHGAMYKGRMAGTMGVVSTFSTMFGKHHSTGAQGGVVFTRDTMIFARVRQITDRGKPFGAVSPQGNTIASLNFNQDEISLAIGRVQLKKLPEFLKVRRAFAAEVEAGIAGLGGVEFIGPPDDSVGAYWFLLIRLDPVKLTCDNTAFCTGLALEGIEGVHEGYPFFPTDQAWHRDAVVFGASGLPWSLDQRRPAVYPLPNAHAASKLMVRIDVHERLGSAEARELVTAIAKLASHFRRSAA